MSDTSPSPEPLSIVVVSGNPRVGSRTTATATYLGELLARFVGVSAEVQTIELAATAPQLYAPEHPDVDADLKLLAGADLAVIATPVYKASSTGLLKSFLDLYGPSGLAGVVAVPLVISASPAHSLVGETALRPLLVELGATVPTRSLAVVESQLGRLDELLSDWLRQSDSVLSAALRLRNDR